MRRRRVPSDHLHSVSYNKRRRRLRVWFKPKTRKDGTTPPPAVYDYWPVPLTADEAPDQPTVEGLLAAESVGEYFNRHFRLKGYHDTKVR